MHALARISQFMNIHKRRMAMKAFISSEYGCCPSVWMFHSRKLNSRVNKLHERALRIEYRDYASSFTEILEKGNLTTIHNRNIQLLADDLFKVKNGLSPPFMKEMFVGNAQLYYDLRKKMNLREMILKQCTTKLELYLF